MTPSAYVCRNNLHVVTVFSFRIFNAGIKVFFTSIVLILMPYAIFRAIVMLTKSSYL